MKQFKKRTIALVLASVVTVVGAFGADNYKNSLMGLSFENSTGENIDLVVHTKRAYEGNVTPMRKDANTYVLMLPEMNSLASTPNLTKVSSDILSVNIRTMPYSNTAKGYTRITIKTTTPSINLSAKNQVYVKGANEDIIPIEQRKDSGSNYKKYSQQPTTTTKETVSKKQKKVINNGTQRTKLTEQPKKVSQSAKLIETPISPEPTGPAKQSSDSNTTYIWLWALLIVLSSAFFYTKAQNKMQEIAGEKINIDVNDEKDNKNKRKKLNKIKNTINSLDSAYSKTSALSGIGIAPFPTAPAKTAKPAEELDIVDLDELFQEHKAKSSTKEDEENNALEDFLSGFSFDDTKESQEENNNTDDTKFRKELYEQIIKNDSIKFSKDDVACINQLLDTEINDETRRNIEKYAVSSPSRKVVPKRKILEDLVTGYAVSQNITFSTEDIKTLYSLINVELDTDFISDLRTNPSKVEEMEKDILAYGDKPKKPSEIITLSVKDMLPDLSEALKKQGNKKFESNRKAETIYFSEGYEVNTLSLDESLPDLSVEINKKESYISKPSAAYEYVDTTYAVGSSELKIASELPDLKDALANPEKYATPEPEKIIVDEDSLLKNISNVTFKPFYDGTNEFEVLNDFSDVPTVSDIQQEFSQFDGFEITQEEPVTEPSIQEGYDDFSSLYSNEYFDLDKQAEPATETEAEEIQKAKLSREVRPNSANELMKKIEATKIEREIRKARLVKKETVQEIEDNVKVNPIETTKCILQGETYNIISQTEISPNKGFYLGKNSKGYVILGYIGDSLQKLKEYETLKSEKIHARLSEKLPSGTLRYLIRIGLQKIIVNVKEDCIEYVMDLC